MAKYSFGENPNRGPPIFGEVMKKIVDYWYQEGTNSDLRNLINKGWEPFGSPLSGDCGKLIQAFVRYEEDSLVVDPQFAEVGEDKACKEEKERKYYNLLKDLFEAFFVIKKYEESSLAEIKKSFSFYGAYNFLKNLAGSDFVEEYINKEGPFYKKGNIIIELIERSEKIIKEKLSGINNSKINENQEVMENNKISEKSKNADVLVEKEDWIWLPHAAYFSGWRDCGFRMDTVVGKFVVSTVGEYRPDHKIGEFKMEEIGVNRLYQTSVFRAKPMNVNERCDCCEFSIGEQIDFKGYNDAKSAYDGHLEFCEKYSRVY